MIHVLRGEGATFSRIAPAGFRLLAALDRATESLGINLDITCGTEGHAADDVHTRGLAYDVRIRGFSPVVILRLVTLLRDDLGPAFTVLLETPVSFMDPQLQAIEFINPHATGPHLHLQRAKHTVFPPVTSSEHLA